MSTPRSSAEAASNSTKARVLIKPLGIGIVLLTTIAISLWVAPTPAGRFGAALAIFAVAVAVIDYKTFRIPNWLNFLGFTVALFHAGLLEPEARGWSVATAVLRAAALALIFLLLRVGFRLVRGREGLGLGDVKLAAVAGAWLDWLFIPIAIQLAAFGALSAYSLKQLLSDHPIGLSSRLPFGTFFAPAVWLSWVIEQVLFR